MIFKSDCTYQHIKATITDTKHNAYICIYISSIKLRTTIGTNQTTLYITSLYGICKPLNILSPVKAPALSSWVILLESNSDTWYLIKQEHANNIENTALSRGCEQSQMSLMFPVLNARLCKLCNVLFEMLPDLLELLILLCHVS